MIVYRHKDPAVSPDTFHPLIEKVQSGVHDDEAKIEEAPKRVNSVTMFQFLFQKAVRYSLPQPQLESQQDSMDSGMTLTPQSGEKLETTSLFEILQKDPKWMAISISEVSDLQEGDVLFATHKEAHATHQLAIATLSMGAPMLLVTDANYDAPSIMAVEAFLGEYTQETIHQPEGVT